MKDNSLAKLGGICSILVGVSYIVIGIVYVLMPIPQRTGVYSQEYLYSVARDPTFILIEYWAFALGAILALVAVPAISARVRSVNEGWARWASNLGLLGFMVTAVNYFYLLTVEPDRTAAFAVGDDVTRKAIIYSQFTFDPNGWLGFGAVGVWILVVSVLAIRSNTLPKMLGYLGIIAAIVYWLVVLGNVTNQLTLISIAAGLGGVILGPIWYIWMGLKLRQPTAIT